MEKYKVLPVKIDESIVEKKPLVISSIEDCYVINGDEVSGSNQLRDSNFGASEVLQFKGDSKNGKLFRKVFIKFDLSGLVGEPVKRVSLRLYGVSAQGAENTDAFLYETDAEAWNEKEITFNNAPEEGKLITVAKAGKSHNFWDISDYVTEKLAEGKKIVSFVLIGDEKEPFHVQFASSRHGTEYGPSLVVSYSENGFLTQIATNTSAGEVWERAAKMVEEWADDWYDVLQRGDAPAKLVKEKPEEYANLVDVSSRPDKPYVKRPTRLVENIKGYEQVKKGEIKLDEYGGYICDKKFNATGWFHVEEKDGRLWTVTPEGNPFFRMAMVSISPGGEGRQHNAVMAKHGTLENWAEYETVHLRDDLGYNALGGWSSINLLSNVKKPLALSQIVNFVSMYARTHGMNNSTGGSTTFVGGSYACL